MLEELTQVSGSAEVARQARIDLAAAFQLAVVNNFHEGVCNHFSLAVPGTDDRFLLNSYGLHFSEVTASNLLVVNAEGHLVEGNGIVEATAFYIHSRIHQLQPHARCILHTHMPYATALTMIEGGRLEPAGQNALRFYGHVAYDEDYNGLVLDKAEGDRVVSALGDKKILFLGNHGVIVVGTSVAEAFDDLYYLERACQAQVLAMSTGRPLKMVAPEIAHKTMQQIQLESANAAQLHFAALKRLLNYANSNYAD